MNKLFVFFSAGCLGGLANSLIVWNFGYLGINSFFGVAISPVLTPEWLYPRIVWGGIWGVFFMLPILQSKIITKGALLSILPSIIQIFVVFPLKADKGIAGLELGYLTPILVLFFNLVWGVVSAYAIKSCQVIENKLG